MMRSVRQTDQPDMRADGDALLRSGDFQAAEAAYRALLAADDRNARAWRGLSAVMRRSGNAPEARALLRHAARLCPVERRGNALPLQSRVLRARAIDATDYCAVKRREGGFKTKYKGGHFSTTNLLPRDGHDWVVANLVDRDPAPLYAAPPADLFLNTVACADRGAGALSAIAGFLADHPHLPVINRPEAVARTSRDENYQRLGKLDGVVFPRTIRLALDAPMPELTGRIAASGIDLPLILRATGRQTGRQTYLCRSHADLDAALRRLADVDEAYVIAYHDHRDATGRYTKARAFFIDGRVYPVAWLTSDHWQIHSGDRYRVMPDCPVSQSAERAYLSDPERILGPRAWAALHAIGRTLALDFAGIDFTVTPDGALFVFEANAAMRHNFDHTAAFPYTRPYLERVSHGFAAMVAERIATSDRPCDGSTSHCREFPDKR